MGCFRWVVVAGLILACTPVMRGEEWKPAKGALVTRWTKQVSPGNVLPEYPRPQMVRKEWMNLNGVWEYAIKPKDEARPGMYDGNILVPFAVESALSGVMKGVTEKERLWYRRMFTVPGEWKGKTILLHFGAVDWEATVYVNGKEAGSHKGGYDGFTFDITPLLKDGDNEIVVGVWDPTNGGPYPKGKQNIHAIGNPGGIYYTPATGIWQTVWLEPVEVGYIRSLKITPDVDAQRVKVNVDFVATGGMRPPLEVVVLEGGKEIARGSGNALEEMSLAIPNPRLWSPDDPFLYDIRVTLYGNDTVSSYFGMRKISIGKDSKGITRILLNNKFVFQMGFLDQGYWPDGIYTAPTDAALKWDIEISKKLGMNMARKHVKVEPDRWYYWADKLGLLVWQDMPSGTQGNTRTDVRKDDESANQFETELKRMIDGRGNHPSIVMWVVFNEGWGQYDTPRITQWVKQYDPGRLVSNASGWTDRKCGDVLDMHKYPGPGSPQPEENRAAVLGEFGGLGLAIAGHTWVDKSWGYKNEPDAAALTRRYIKLMREVYKLKNQVGLSAAVYTQTTDVETECNGLITYDREVIKVDVDLVAAANRGHFPPAEEVIEIVPTAQEKPATWRYTTDQPAANWNRATFDDSAWQRGAAGFGHGNPPGSKIRTEWPSRDIWLRREFVLADPIPAAVLLIHHDEDAEIYINGELAARVKGFLTSYDQVDISPRAKATLRPGKNVLAVHCRNTTGGQYIDVGLGEVKAAGNP